MNEQVKKKWPRALRSGTYSQGKEKLRDIENNFCCLGVLCDVVPPKNHSWQNHGINGPWRLKGPDNIYYGMLPRKFRQAIHLSTKDQNILIHMNDDGKSFEQIANWIEKNL